MIIEKILNILFNIEFLSDINIDLPTSARSAVSATFSCLACLGQLVDLSSFLFWTLLLIGFHFYLAIFTLIVKLLRG